MSNDRYSPFRLIKNLPRNVVRGDVPPSFHAGGADITVMVPYHLSGKLVPRDQDPAPSVGYSGREPGLMQARLASGVDVAAMIPPQALAIAGDRLFTLGLDSYTTVALRDLLPEGVEAAMMAGVATVGQGFAEGGGDVPPLALFVRSVSYGSTVRYVVEVSQRISARELRSAKASLLRGVVRHVAAKADMAARGDGTLRTRREDGVRTTTVIFKAPKVQLPHVAEQQVGQDDGEGDV